MEYTKQFLIGMYHTYHGCLYYFTAGKQLCGAIEEISKDGWVNNNIQIDETQLALTPISEITDEDAIEVAKMWGCSKFHLASDGFFQIIKDDGVSVEHYMSFSYPNKLWSGVVDLLRSKGYDCGYQHVSSLIGAGLAISINDLKK